MAKVITIPVGGSTLIINNHSITQFGQGEIISLSYENKMAERIYGVGNSVNINERVDADVAVITFNVMRYRDDDFFLSALINQDPIATLYGSLQEGYRADDEDAVGNWILSAGSFQSHPDKKINNQTGEETVEYMIECIAKRNV